MQPKVTIVIPFYNCPYVNRAIESALGQTYPNVETIVVDDGSTEMTTLLKPYANRVRLIRKPNGGTASALNLGIQCAKGEYIAWLSSDDCFYPTKLEKQMAFMMEHGADISFTDYDLIDADDNLIQTAAAMKFCTVTEFYRQFLTGCPVNGCTVMISKKLFKKVGLFNEQLPFTHDYDLWMRIILTRADFYYLNSRTVQYRKHEKAGSVRHQVRIQPEIRATRERYAAKLAAFIAMLEEEGRGQQ